MKTLSQAISELQNQWYDILFIEGNSVAITQKGVIVDSAEMTDVNDDAEVAEFVEAFLNEA